MPPSGTNRNGFNAQDARPILPHSLVSNSIRAAIVDSTARAGTISMTIHGLPLVTPHHLPPVTQVRPTVQPTTQVQLPPTSATVRPPGETPSAPEVAAPVIGTDSTVKHTAIKVAQQQEAGKQEQPRSSKTIVIAQTSTGLKEVPTVLPNGRSTTTTIPFTSVVDVTTVIQEPVNPTGPATPVSATTKRSNVGMMVGFSLAGLFLVTSILIALLYLRSRLKYRRTAMGQISSLPVPSNDTRPSAPQKMRSRTGKLVTLDPSTTPFVPEPADPFDDSHEVQQSRYLNENQVAGARSVNIMTRTVAQRISMGSESVASDATLPSYHTCAVIEPTRRT